MSESKYFLVFFDLLIFSLLFFEVLSFLADLFPRRKRIVNFNRGAPFSLRRVEGSDFNLCMFATVSVQKYFWFKYRCGTLINITNKVFLNAKENVQ
jgi:hypothetical protein